MQKKIGKRVAGETPKMKKPKKKSRLTGLQKGLLAVVIVLAVVLAAVAAYKNLFVRPDLSNKGHGAPGTEQEAIDYGDGVRPRAEGQRKSKDFYTVLILGRDTGGGGNTDTMLLASYDVTNQKAAVMSIPRDTMVNIPYDVKKINAVYNYGGQGEKGIQALYKEIAQLVGFEPDYQVIVEWEAVGKIVDAIGGVYFDVPYDMDYHDPYQDLVIEQAKGYRLLSGDDAMQVIRWRKNDPGSPYGYTTGVGDSGRMGIQQDFLKAVIKQLMTPANVLNIGKLSKVFQESVETDLSFQEILWFGQQAVSGGLSVENVEFFTMPYKGASAWSRSYKQNLSYVIPKANDLLDIVNNKLSPFVETFTLSDLDIMSVNSDGSLRSTTGYVEDAKAAVPPVKPSVSEPVEPPAVDESGNLIDPETGTVIPPDPGTGDVIVIDPSTGEAEAPDAPETEETDTPSTPETSTPETGASIVVTPEPDTPPPPPPAQTQQPEETPAVTPEEPVSPDFIIIEPPPAA